MVSPSNTAAHELAALDQAEQLGQRPGRRVALQARDGARREDQHAVRGLAAQRLLPGEGGDIDLVPGDGLGEHRRGGVGEGEAGAVGGDPVAVRHAHARGGAVPGEQHVAAEIDLGEIGQLAVLGLEDAQVGELELLGDVRHPALAEALPGQRIDAALAQHGPHGHLEGAGVGGRARWRRRSRRAGPAAPWSPRWRASGAPCLPWRDASGRETRCRGL